MYTVLLGTPLISVPKTDGGDAEKSDRVEDLERAAAPIHSVRVAGGVRADLAGGEALGLDACFYIVCIRYWCGVRDRFEAPNRVAVVADIYIAGRLVNGDPTGLPKSRDAADFFAACAKSLTAPPFVVT